MLLFTDFWVKRISEVYEELFQQLRNTMNKHLVQFPKHLVWGENRAAEKIRGVNKKELGANIWSAAQFTIHKSQQKRPERPDLELTQIGRGNMSHFLKWKY